MSDVSILWLRTALRVHDNPVLAAALRHEYCLPIYVFDPSDQDPLAELAELTVGNAKTRKVGEHRARFLLESLTDLQTRFEALGSGIVYRRGDPVEVLQVLAKAALGADFGSGPVEGLSVYVDDQPGSEEQALFRRVGRTLEGLSPKPVTLEVIWEKSVYHPDDIPFPPADNPSKFKDFWHGVTKTTPVREPVQAPETMPGLPKGINRGDLPSLEDLGYTQAEIANSDTRAYPGGETEGLARLAYYAFESEQLTNYRWTRNRSLGADYSSKWSAYLAQGCLSARHVWREVKRYEVEVKKNASTYWIIRELIWRDYYQIKALQYPRRMFWPKGVGKKDYDWKRDEDTFRRWATGTTGIPFLDAHMRELRETGFMSNRGRVNAASWLSRDQGVLWTWGAAWFESYLLDYDVASNWLNWSSQATELRPTNPIWQGRKYDADGAYVYEWIPELKSLPAPLVQGWFGLDDAGLVERGLEVPKDYARPPEVKDKWQWALKRILGPDGDKPLKPRKRKASAKKSTPTTESAAERPASD